MVELNSVRHNIMADLYHRKIRHKFPPYYYGGKMSAITFMAVTFLFRHNIMADFPHRENRYKFIFEGADRQFFFLLW